MAAQGGGAAEEPKHRAAAHDQAELRRREEPQRREAHRRAEHTFDPRRTEHEEQIEGDAGQAGTQQPLQGALDVEGRPDEVIGGTYQLLDFDEGLEHAREAIRLYREVGNRYRAASKLNLHPLILIEMGRTDEAIACLEEYEMDFADIDDVKVIIQSDYARGCLALSNGDLEQAEKCFIKALDTAKENDCSESVALSLQNLGLIRLEQGIRKEALEYLRQGFQALDDTVYFRNYVPDAEYFLMTGDTKRAVHFAGKALARAQATGNSVNLRRSREILEELGSG